MIPAHRHLALLGVSEGSAYLPTRCISIAMSVKKDAIALKARVLWMDLSKILAISLSLPSTCPKLAIDRGNFGAVHVIHCVVSSYSQDQL